MTEWSQAVWIAIGLLIGAFVITIAVYYAQKGRDMNNEVSLQEARREAMVEYRTFNGFNDKVVYSQDVVSLILQYNSKVATRVMRGTTTVGFWCTNSGIKENIEWTGFSGAEKDEYSTTKIQELLDVNKVYKCNLTYGANGEVMGVTCLEGTIDATTGDFVEG